MVCFGLLPIDEHEEDGKEEMRGTDLFSWEEETKQLGGAAIGLDRMVGV